MNHRSAALRDWLDGLGYEDYSLEPASEDASFRSYWRLRMNRESWVVMDAPPELEPCDRFIAIAQKLRDAKLNAPEVIAQDLQQGFLLLTDFGASDYLSLLNPETEARLYADAFAALLRMQTRVDADDLPAYDVALLDRELDLFHDWFLQKLMGLELDREQQRIWLATRKILIDNALEQPQVFVHRDYHSRNLMKVDHHNPGILDFQDAVKGPVTYDLVSLLRDCYIEWPPPRVERLALDYYEKARAEGLVEVESKKFMHWFNLTGTQRHLKAIGIFSRLSIRDGKDGYLRDIPRTLEYVRRVSGEESSLSGLLSIVEDLELGAGVESLAKA